MVEVIMTLAVLGAVICPLMNILVISQKINSEGENEYRIVQTAQYYMEETRSMEEIDTEVFVYNSEKRCYERTVLGVMDCCSAEIRITPDSYGLYYIKVDIVSDGEVIESLEGSIILK